MGADVELFATLAEFSAEEVAALEAVLEAKFAGDAAVVGGAPNLRRDPIGEVYPHRAIIGGDLTTDAARGIEAGDDRAIMGLQIHLLAAG